MTVNSTNSIARHRQPALTRRRQPTRNARPWARTRFFSCWSRSCSTRIRRKPQDQGELIAQLATFSSLEKLTQIATQHRCPEYPAGQDNSDYVTLFEEFIMAVGSFSAGLSGLNANAVYLSVIGNNLANINTVGFKSSSVSFMDLVSQTVGGSSGNPMQVGLGVVTGSISPVFSQGAIENTREATNVAIQGGGLFVVNGAEGNTYTRAGQFSFDSKGTLVTPDGYHVQGYTTIDPSTGVILATGQPTDITDPARRAAAAERDGDLRHDLEPGRRRRGGDDSYHRRADLRCARRAARRDDYLHEGRRCRSVDLRHHGSGRGNHGRHRRHAILHRRRARCSSTRPASSRHSLRRHRRRVAARLRQTSRSRRRPGRTALRHPAHVGHRRCQQQGIDYRLLCTLGHLVEDPERFRARHGGQHQHQRRRHDHRDVRCRTDRRHRPARAGDLQQSQGAREARVEPLRRERRRRGCRTSASRAPAGEARSSAARSNNPTWTSRRSSRR